jgi:hypothetical protein
LDDIQQLGYCVNMGARKFVTPEPGEDLAAIAARVLPGDDSGDDSAQQLLSWNLHLAARAGSGLSVGLLPSDIVFTEPPPKRGTTS